MDSTQTREIYVYDHPESKIRFLEMTLRGQDWRLRIAYPANDPKAISNIAAVRAACDRKGYVLKDSTDASGNSTLELHHLGEGGNPSQLLSELGLVRGTGHLITHPSITIDALTQGAQSLGKKAWHIARDPARANGIIYLAAEGFLVSSGGSTNKAEGLGRVKFFTPHNILQKLAYSFFLMQSGTYLFFAKNNNDAAFDQYKNKLSTTLKQGGTAESVVFEAKGDQEKKGPVRTMINYIRRYPIQIGAAFNDIGMGVYMLRSVYKKKWYTDLLASKLPVSAELLKEATEYTASKAGRFKISGFHRDIAGAVVSMVAWAFLLITPKKHSDEEKEQIEGKPLHNAWQKFRENPQVGAGLLTLLSSSLRFSSALTTNDKRQQWGEGIYIGGDLALLFTKNDNYGSKNSKDVEVVAQRLADHIATLPCMFGPEAQEKVVTSMATFLRAKTLQEIKDNPQAIQYTIEELNARREILVRETKLRIRNHQDERIERVADAANRITQYVPNAERSALVEQLSEAFSHLPWVHVTPAEMYKAIVDSQGRKPEITPPQNDKELREAIADLTDIVPHIDKGITVAAIYDTLGAHLNRPASAQATSAAQAPVTSTAASTLMHSPAADISMNDAQPTTHVHQVERQINLMQPAMAAAQAH